MKKVQLVIKKGFSAIEVLLSASVFVIVVSAFVGAIIFGIQSQKTAGQYNQAVLLAEETFEAIKNIRDSGYSNIPNIDGIYYLSSSGNQWSLTSVPEPAINGFTRSILISTIDANTKQIVVNINFSPSAHRTKTLSYSGKITNWISNTEGGGSPKKRGLLAYYDATAGRNTLTSRQYDDIANTFGVEEDIALGAGQNSRNIVLKTSPIKGEAILAYGDNAGNLKVLCYDDTTDVWTQDFTATIGGTGTTKRFDVGYEKTTGDVIVVYSNNTATTNELAYRTKSGSSACNTGWSGAINLDTIRTSGIVQWVNIEEANNSGNNSVAVAWADNASDLSANIWNGTSWVGEPSATLETNLEYATTSQDIMSFDLAYETSSGNLMIVWSPLGTGTTACTTGATLNANSCIKYSRYTTSWQATSAIPAVADRGTNIDLAANPLSTSNQIVLGAMDNGTGDLSHAYWSGSSWTGAPNIDTSTQAPTAGSKRIACSWLNSGATARSVCTYNDSGATNIGWVVGNLGTFVIQTDFAVTPVFANPQQWYDMDVNPNSQDTLMFSVSDNGADLFMKRLVMTSTPTFTWTNTEGGTALETTLSQSTAKPFGFTFWKVIPIAKVNNKENYYKKYQFALFNIFNFYYDRRRYV